MRHTSFSQFASSGQKAHRRAHESHGGADDDRLKQYRMGLPGIAPLSGQPNGTGASHNELQAVGQAELHQHHRPACTRRPGSGWLPAHCLHLSRSPEAPRLPRRACRTIGVDRDNHRQKGENHALRLIFWHKTLLGAQKSTSRLPHPLIHRFRNQIYMHKAQLVSFLSLFDYSLILPTAGEKGQGRIFRQISTNFTNKP